MLHHVMGELEGIKGAWGYVEGRMGSVTQAMARSSASRAANIFVDTVFTFGWLDSTKPRSRNAWNWTSALFGDFNPFCEVSDGNHSTRRTWIQSGLVLNDGTEIRSKAVLSNATPKVTYIDLLEKLRWIYLFPWEITGVRTKYTVVMYWCPWHLSL